MTPAVTEVLLIMQPLFREFAHPGIFATATSWVLWPLSLTFTYLYVCPHVPRSEFLLSAQLHLLLPCCASAFPLPGPQSPSLLTSFLGPQLVPSPSLLIPGFSHQCRTLFAKSVLALHLYEDVPGSASITQLKTYFTVWWVSPSRDFSSFSNNFPFLIVIHTLSFTTDTIINTA